MKRGYYIHAVDKYEFQGVYKKIQDQIMSFSDEYDISEIHIESKNINKIKLALWCLPLFSYGRDYNSAIERMRDEDSKNSEPVELIYIRKQAIDRAYGKFLSNVRKMYPRAKIVMEIPTYPYKKELTDRLGNYPYYIKDTYYSKKIKQWIDYYASYSREKEIHGVITINIVNGIDVKRVQMAKVGSNGDNIHMLAVAWLQKHHGYERVIEGLRLYYRNKPCQKIFFHIVGDGPERAHYEKLVEDYHLKDFVIFHGSLTGKDLDKIYDGMDIAISSLGMYKLNLDYSSVLKSREYLAKGMPMVIGCTTDVFVDNDFSYYVEYPNDDTPIDMGKIIEFENRIRKEGIESVSENIREFAENTVDIRNTMKVVMNRIGVKE